jgi:hypothetical protein
MVPNEEFAELIWSWPPGEPDDEDRAVVAG